MPIVDFVRCGPVGGLVAIDARGGIVDEIATRLTSWVAIDEDSHVEGPSRHEVQPQELPYGTSMGSFGLRAASAPIQKTMMLGGVGS